MARTIEYDINIGGNAPQTLGQMEDNLQMLNDEIRGVDRNSEAFEKLSGEIQKANTQLEKANLEIEGFTDERKVKAFQGSIDVFTGSVEAFSGIAVGLGLANEEFEETVTQLLSVAATANGIRTATQGLVDLREALKSSATAQRILNAAANANPYVILATAVAAAAVAFYAFGEDAEEATPKVRGLKEEVQAINDIEFQNTNFETFTAALETLNNIGAGEGIRNTTSGFAELRAALADTFGLTSSQIEKLRGLSLEKQLEFFKGYLQLQLQGNVSAAERLRISKEILNIEERLGEIREENPPEREAVRIANEIEATKELMDVKEASLEQKEVEIKVNDEVTDNQTGSIDAQLGALNDFANQAAQLAEDNKALAIGAVITNAAVAGIAAWRSWTEDGPFGPIGNQIAAGVQIGIIALSSLQAIKSIQSAGQGGAAGSSGVAFGPTVSTPSAGQVPQTSPSESGTDIQGVAIAQEESQANMSVVAVVEQGDVSDGVERQARLNNRRKITG